MSEKILPLEIVCEDGTPISEAPVNPLIEQWKQEGYTKKLNGDECHDILGYYEDGRPIMNYTCVYCNSPYCYLSRGWKIPDKDKDVYEKWKEDSKEFDRLHNPELFASLYERTWKVSDTDKLNLEKWKNKPDGLEQLQNI